MKLSRFRFLPLIAVLLVAACGYHPSLSDAQYWQRAETHSALYMQGAKAQQALEEDIAACVKEIEELVRLGAVRHELPAGESNERAYSIPVGQRDAYWNVPQRFGYRYVDHSQYHDFDSCMRFKGWKRVAYNSYETLELSNDTYQKLRNDRMGFKARSQKEGSAAYKGEPGANYDHLND